MPSPHSSSSHSSSSSSHSSPSSHSSSSHSSSSYSGSSRSYSSGSSSSRSSGSWGSSRSSSSYDSYSSSDDSGSDLPFGAQLVILVISILVTLIIFGARSCSETSSASSRSVYDANHRQEDGWVYYGNGAWGKTYSYSYSNNQSGNSGSKTNSGQNGDIGDSSGGGSNIVRPETNPSMFGNVVWLRSVGPDAYMITEDETHDREMVWNEAEESYFDEDSELWAWYNTSVDPPLWQYWYEPISGDYGDYGWMEYEDGLWYIEFDKGDWDLVPEEYDVSPLWHIESSGDPVYDETPSDSWFCDDSEEDLSYTDPDLFGRELRLKERVPGIYRITEDGSDKVLLWDDETKCYREEDDGVRVWYDADAETPCWRYWYEPISKDYSPCGWLRYEAEVWYVEAAPGSWIETPEKYDTSALWHIETDE